MNSRLSLRLLTGLSVLLSIGLAACGSDDNGSGAGTGGSAGTASGGTGGGGGAGSGGTSGSSGGTAGSGGTVGSGGTAGSGNTAGSGASGGSSGGTAGSGGTAADFFFFGDYKTDGKHEVARVDGTTQASLALAALAGEDISAIAASPDGKLLAVAGVDQPAGNVKLVVYDALGIGAKTLATAADDTREIDQIVFSPDSKWVAFRADLGITAGANGLWVVPADGSSAAKQVSPAKSDNQLDVTSFKWSRDVGSTDAYIAFTGDVVTQNVFGLWTVNVLASSPTVMEVVTQAELGADGDVDVVLDWASGGKLYFTADFEVDGVHRLYSVDKDGKNRAQVTAAKMTNGGGATEASVGAISVSPAGTHIAFASDSPLAGLNQVFVMPLSGGAPTVQSSVQVALPSSGSFGPDSFSARSITWSPNGMLLGVISDWQVASTDLDNAFSAFVLPATGAAGGVRIVGVPAAGNQDVEQLGFSKDSTRLIVLGDMVNNGDAELFVTTNITAADQSATSIRFTQVVSGGDIDGFVTP